MTNKIEKDLSTKERILAFKLSQEFTAEDLQEISGAVSITYGAGGYTNSPTFDARTGQYSQDAYFDGGADL